MSKHEHFWIYSKDLWRRYCDTCKVWENLAPNINLKEEKE